MKCFSPVAGIQWVETLGVQRLAPYCSAFTTSFSPVAGIQWVETSAQPHNATAKRCFSPVAGIQWVETLLPSLPSRRGSVSVPLPGFSGLRLGANIAKGLGIGRFSPVAGIQWVETLIQSQAEKTDKVRFSPVAGIQWVETADR